MSRHGTPRMPGPIPDRAAGHDHPRYAPLRERRWTPGELPFTLTISDTGVDLGIATSGRRLGYPLLVPHQSTRVGVVADRRLAQLLTLRLVALSCDVTVVTSGEARWQRLVQDHPAVPFTVARHVRRWPPRDTSSPPWALVVDMADPPPANFTHAPWSTVIHVAPAVPHGSAWWQGAHLILAGPAHAHDVAALRPRLDPAVLVAVSDGDLLAVEQSAATVFRPVLREYEARALQATEQAT